MNLTPQRALLPASQPLGDHAQGKGLPTSALSHHCDDVFFAGGDPYLRLPTDYGLSQSTEPDAVAVSSASPQPDPCPRTVDWRSDLPFWRNHYHQVPTKVRMYADETTRRS